MDRRFCNVIEHPDVADVQPVLRLAEPAEPLDATLADLRRLVSEVPVDGIRHLLFDNLEGGMTIDEVMEQFPVTREQVKAELEFAARSWGAPPLRGADAHLLRRY
jgi:Protein of unknown function (DUF433)